METTVHVHVHERSRPRQRPRQRSPIAALLELFFVTVDVAVVVDVHVNVAVDGFSLGCGFATLGPWWLKSVHHQGHPQSNNPSHRLTDQRQLFHQVRKLFRK